MFGVSRRVNGRMKRIRIGAYHVVSLADAREKTQHILHNIKLSGFADASSVAEPAPRLTPDEVAGLRLISTMAFGLYWPKMLPRKFAAVFSGEGITPHRLRQTQIGFFGRLDMIGH